MTTEAPLNRRIVLAQRPIGSPTAADFRLEEVPLPELADGQVLLRTLYLSIDPYMRARMSDAPSYAQPVAIDAVMVGATVCRVEASRSSSLAVGDVVLSMNGWQDYAAVSTKGLMKIDASLAPPSYSLGVLGMTGFTAYVGLLDIGQAKEGDTVLVSAATGAVGGTVGQIAKLKGCRAVGIAGGDDKCEYAVNTLGYDACINHYDEDFAEQLAAACPNGVDVYFENVGGNPLMAAIPLLNVGARVALCGIIAWLNGPAPGPIDTAPQIMRALLNKRASVQGFVITDHYATRHADFRRDMSQWVKEGKIHYREDVIEGLERAPFALMGLLRGDNFGKVVVRVEKTEAT
ncbi:NADP-dependent oxidoreductase [Stenotrophobium rhamnosiphilum]|uniref:NADP-dependent oxidoreductase n=1 Tax=Stenotrophobium rhamnosiphilum TaxID=2029166 RepID=A0A2T5MK17_9GAMM|nr:NADP-dependent oxidoreductase [Stenotrophobium rhamnosiphilum]PTU32908.1 NADP-dependent oxidoreductase [Stenotrophobium rhamnosiphilum]